jgi:SAM-dependent methyltransferase
VRAVAEAFGYTPEELASIPAEANMGLSCGNPVATAGLRPGEVVVDLGCGGGLDVLLAAPKVGAAGRVIGIDMSPQMIETARQNAARGAAGRPVRNVEFHLSTIDRMPLTDASVDCVISNCVINLAPEKRAVIREIHRVLRPGGRVAISDIALKRPLPPELKNSLAAYVGCIAGAIFIEDYRQLLLDSGFAAVQVADTGSDLSSYAKAENTACCTPSPEPGTSLPVADAGSCSAGKPAGSELSTQLADLLRRCDVNEYAASVRIFAVKPAEDK